MISFILVEYTEVVVRRCSKNFAVFAGKHLCWCFLVNIEKFFRTSFFIEYFWMTASEYISTPNKLGLFCILQKNVEKLSEKLSQKKIKKS